MDDSRGGTYVDNAVEVRASHSWREDDYRVTGWVRARGGSVKPGATLATGGGNTTLLLGTLDAFYGFLASDDVSFSGLAILPPGVYPQKMVNGGMSYYNGAATHWSFFSGRNALEVGVGAGKPYILDENEWEKSLVNDVDPWIDIRGESYRSARLSYTYGSRFSALLVHDTVDVRVVKQWDWSNLDLFRAYPGIGAAVLVRDPDYRLTIQRIGIRYAFTSNFEVVWEYAALTVKNGTFQPPGSKNFYALAYYSLDSQWELTAGRSVGNPDDKAANTSTHGGVNFRSGKLKIATEFHRVIGDSWWSKKDGTDRSIDSLILGWSYAI